MVRIVALLLVLSSASLVEAQSLWMLDDQQTAVRFTCAGPGVTDPGKGRFAAVMGQVALDPADLRNARGAVGVLLASIASDLPGWDAMFRGAGFLDLDRFPRATFELSEVRGAQALRQNNWVRVQLVGRMTVHGQHHEMTIPARVRWTPAAGESQEQIEILATFRLQFEDFEIAVPEGWTRRFAGDSAQVRVRMVYYKR